MNILKGGACPCVCFGAINCPCLYEGPYCGPTDDYWGGSSTIDNSNANNPGLENLANNNAYSNYA